MSGARVPLSVLDLAPVSTASSATEALANTLDLARHLEAAGYLRHWIAEHHFAPGVASSAPAVVIGHVAAGTSTIRVGSAAVQTGHQTAISIVEQFATLATLFPGRIDLGLGRSGQVSEEIVRSLGARDRRGSERKPRPRRGPRVVDGLLVPGPFDLARMFEGTALVELAGLLKPPGAQTPAYREQVAEVLALLEGTATTPSGTRYSVSPPPPPDLPVWIFGSSKGESARVAGANGLPFGANYHVSPSTVLEAIAAYRDAFQPSAHLAEPYVAVSADVVVAETSETARRLASPYALWVRSIRTGQGAVAYPGVEDAAAHRWSDEDLDLVVDRTSTQFVGTPDEVVEGLDTLVRVTGADEVITTTITGHHRDRVRSHLLLAEAWGLARADRPGHEHAPVQP